MVNDVNSKVPANAMGIVQEMRKNKNYSAALEDFQKQSKAQAEAKVLPAYKQKLEEANAFANSINNGQSVTLQGVWNPATKSSSTKTVSPKEIIENIKSGKAKFHIDAGQIIYDDGTIKVDIPRYGIGPSNAPAMRKVFEQVAQYSRKGYFDIKREADKKVDEEYKNILAPRVSKFVPQIKALPLDKDGSLTPLTLQRMAGLVTATVRRGVKADSEYDPKVVSDMLLAKNNKDTRIFVQQSGDDFEVQVTSLTDPSKVQRIKVNKAEIIANLGSQYVNELTQESMRVGIGGGNTNLTRDPNRSMMQKAIGDFPGIRRMNITADLDQDLSNPDLFIPGVNIKKKNGRYEFFQLSGIDNLSRVGYEQGRRNLNALTDDVLLKYLKVEYPNYDYSKLDIK
jgi:hypothetical protein